MTIIPIIFVEVMVINWSSRLSKWLWLEWRICATQNYAIAWLVDVTGGSPFKHWILSCVCSGCVKHPYRVGRISQQYKGLHNLDDFFSLIETPAHSSWVEIKYFKCRIFAQSSQVAGIGLENYQNKFKSAHKYSINCGRRAKRRER